MPRCVRTSCCRCIPTPEPCSGKRKSRCYGRTCWPTAHQRALRRSQMVRYVQENEFRDTGRHRRRRCCCCCCTTAHCHSAQRHRGNIHRRRRRCRCRMPPVPVLSAGTPAVARTAVAPAIGGCWRTSPNGSLRGSVPDFYRFSFLFFMHACSRVVVFWHRLRAFMQCQVQTPKCKRRACSE